MATKKANVLTIKLVRSLIGAKPNHVAVAESLGLKKIGDVVSQPDNAATQGKVAKIIHLIEVTNA
ncbi:MAG: 50S ribosomal protein L30 [Clostridia bacterium]|nr:50S ribosomal protein L30 [Clostridia bacterium]